MTWITWGLLAGMTLGLYDFFTKKSMSGNSVFPVVLISAFFGFLSWFPFFMPIFSNHDFYVDIHKTNWFEQGIILIKGMAMTLSWLFAFFSVRELPMSFSGAVRASGPIWTLIGGMFIFDEYLNSQQLFLVFLCVLSYYMLSHIGKSEGIDSLRGLPTLMMLCATILSALITVYDKYMVQTLGMSIIDIQAWSAVHRFILSLLIFIIFFHKDKAISLNFTIWIPLTGLSWVLAEWLYFQAIEAPLVNVTYLSIFRRVSLIVGFFLSVIFLGEKNIFRKSIIISLIFLLTLLLIITK